MFGLPVLLVLLLGGGYVFGMYLPNRPQAVWSTGLSRSGKAIDSIVGTATEKKTIQQFDKSEITTKLDGKAGDQKFSGSFDIKFDKTKADGSLNINVDNFNGKDVKVAAKVLSEVKDKNTFPTIYLQVSGFKNLGLDLFIPKINNYDGKWISLDKDSLKQLGLDESIANTSDTQLTASEYSEVIKTFVDVTDQYILTDDKSKAVLEQKSYVGKERVENTSAYHYTVGLNKAHAKDYCQALINKIADTAAYKKLIKDNTTKDNTIKECKSSIDESKDTDTFDLWIDAKYKLIHKIRFTDEKDKDSYSEFGQNYKGGDSLEIFIYSQEGKSKGKINGKLTSNFKSLTTEGTFTFDYPSTGADSTSLNLTIDISAKPYSGDINVSKPSGTVSISQLLKDLGVDPSAVQSGFSGEDTTN